MTLYQSYLAQMGTTLEEVRENVESLVGRFYAAGWRVEGRLENPSLDVFRAGEFFVSTGATEETQLRITCALEALVVLYAGFIEQANSLVEDDDLAAADDGENEDDDDDAAEV